MIPVGHRYFLTGLPCLSRVRTRLSLRRSLCRILRDSVEVLPVSGRMPVWYEWLPAHAYCFSGLSFKVGDKDRLKVKRSDHQVKDDDS